MADSSSDSDPEQGAGPLLPTREPPSLPELTHEAAVYSGCCLALSMPLLAHLHSLLPPTPALTLSIGSGFGLLEALLNAPPYSVRIVGVEVQPSPNAYLSATSHRVVHGTRFLDALAADAEAWLFVYPRRVSLVSEYMAAHGNGSLQTVIWVGPQADWDDYQACFAARWHLHTQSAGEVGGKPWDLVATARRAH